MVVKTATKATASHLKKNVGSYGILLAILTSITPLVLEHFWPSGDETAREKVTQSHDMVKQTIDENNRVISSELDALVKRVNKERVLRRELEERVISLEDETRYYHGNPSARRGEVRDEDVVTVPHEDSVISPDDVSDESPPEAAANKMRAVPQLEKF